MEFAKYYDVSKINKGYNEEYEPDESELPTA